MLTLEPKNTRFGWMMRHLKGAGMAAAIKSQLKPHRFDSQGEKGAKAKRHKSRGCNTGGKTHFPFEPVQGLVTHPHRKSYYWGL